MTTYDNYLSQGGEVKERDEDAFDDAIMFATEQMVDVHMSRTLYEAHPAIAHALNELDFPVNLRPYFAELAKLSSDIRAKVDDEYKALVTSYEDARDE